MKRVFALVLALTLMLSLSIPAFAEDTVSGSITVTNPTIGETYRLYKIFDATYATETDDQGVEHVVMVDGKAVVSYSIKESDPFFDEMFGADGTADNEFFDYDPETGIVTLLKATGLIEYLTGLVQGSGVSPIDDETLEEGEETIVFDNLAPGYYLVDRGVSSTVTITTNMPDVEIIDKNQQPGGGDSPFNKQIRDEDRGYWTDSAPSNIGDIVEFKLTFQATNYDGDKMVEYYVVRDEKDPALWVEFNDISVVVGEEDLGKGYYFCAGDNQINTGDWTAQKNSSQWAETPEEAGWYLVHYDYNTFEIVIPWISNSTFNAPAADEGYSMTVGENAESLYDSPSDVVVKYSASVGADALEDEDGVKNSATLKWVADGEPSDPEGPEQTTTHVYNLGIEKTDGNGKNLEGAVFELYKDSGCTQPIWVIPTAEDSNVYVLDDTMTNVSGANRTTSREKYQGAWEKYIRNDPNPDTVSEADADILKYNKRNDMVTPADGKLVILGLEAGTYYLKETKAPDGYNQLSAPERVTINPDAQSADFYGYTVYTAEVVNNRGVELPSTGGNGTMMMITIGTMIAMAFAVLLITQKKMSVYHD